MSKHDCPGNIMRLHDNRVMYGCEFCLPSKMQQGNSAAFNRRYQQATYRKDLLQPNQTRDFVKAYGAGKAREYGYSEEMIRRYS